MGALPHTRARGNASVPTPEWSDAHAMVWQSPATTLGRRAIARGYMNADGSRLVKVLFVYDEDGNIEGMWARQLGPTRFQLQNLPMLIDGLSLEDVVEALPTEDDPRPHFVRVLYKSGNRTLWMVLSRPLNESAGSRAVLRRLKALGCVCEGATQSFFAVNVPAHVLLGRVTDLLSELGLEWEYADPPEGDPVYVN